MIVNHSLIDWGMRASDEETFSQMYPKIYNDKKTAFNNEDIDRLMTRLYSCGSREQSQIPISIKNILVLNNIYSLDDFIPEELIPFGIYLAIGTETTEKAESIMKSCLFGVELATSIAAPEKPVEEQVVGAEQKTGQPSLRAEASEDYKKYCLYLQSAELMKKKTEDWVAKDFIVYIYCGMARWSQPPFAIPDFPKECTQIKRVMTTMGNKRLRDVIFFFVRNYPDIVKVWNMRDYTISVPTFCTGWKLEKLSRMQEDARKKEEEVKTLKDFRKSGEEAAKVVLQQHNTQVGGLVDEMRNKLNVVKESANVEEKTVVAAVA